MENKNNDPPKCLFLGTDGFYDVRDFEPVYVRKMERMLISPNFILYYDQRGTYNQQTMLNGDSVLVQLDEKNIVTSIDRRNVDNIDLIMKCHHRERIFH